MTHLRLIVNDQPCELTNVEPRLSLLDLLRDRLRLTGTHAGCEHGICGACSVLFDGEPIRSCLMLAVQAEGHEITTVEGLANADGTLSSLQAAFCDNHGLQCGYCTPGMLIAAEGLLRRKPAPDRCDVVEALSGNLCRCTGYVQIIEAVLDAARSRGARPADDPVPMRPENH